MGDSEFTYINFRVTHAVKKEIEAIAKEYNITTSELMRVLIADVLEDKEDDVGEPLTRKYQRRKVNT